MYKKLGTLHPGLGGGGHNEGYNNYMHEIVTFESHLHQRNQACMREISLKPAIFLSMGEGNQNHNTCFNLTGSMDYRKFRWLYSDGTFRQFHVSLLVKVKYLHIYS